MTTRRRLPPTLVKLVPLLGSPVDGEVLAAVRAIDRALKGAGVDWHDVAAAIAGASVEPPPQLRSAWPTSETGSSFVHSEGASPGGWPTWRRLLSTPYALDWLDLLLREGIGTPTEHKRLLQIREVVGATGAAIGPDNALMVNRLLKQAWIAGLRVEPRRRPR